MAEIMIDTSVLIGYTRGALACRELLDARVPSRRPITHTVCEAELLEGARNTQDMKALRTFVRGFRLVVPSTADLRESVILLQNHVLRFGVDWHDCLIAATSRRLDVPVATCNPKHFACFTGLTVIEIA